MPVHYRAARTWLMTSTFIGLIGFTLLPTCPPRLLDASHGFVDTMAQYSYYGWWGGEASAPRGLGGMTNQYAAMPSLHVGWALWCGVMLWRYGGTRADQGPAVAYPLITTIVVMGTANHYFLDAVAGAAVMGVGLLLAPARPAEREPDEGRGSLGHGPHGRARADAAPPAQSPQLSVADARLPRVSEFPGSASPRASAGPGAEPGAAPPDAGDGAATAAR